MIVPLKCCCLRIINYSRDCLFGKKRNISCCFVMPLSLCSLMTITAMFPKAIHVHHGHWQVSVAIEKCAGNSTDGTRRGKLIHIR